MSSIRALTEELRAVTEAPSAPADPAVVDKISKVLKAGPAKPRNGVDPVVHGIQTHGLGYVEITGKHGMASLDVDLREPGTFGGHGFNPKGWGISEYYMALQDMEDCLKTAENLWAATK